MLNRTKTRIRIVSYRIRLKYLKCPNCRKFTMPLQWSKNGTRACEISHIEA